VLEVVREVFWAWEERSWVERCERAAWIAVRSWRRREISSFAGLFGEPVEVGSEVVEVGAMLLRSARRVSGIVSGLVDVRGGWLEAYRHRCMVYVCFHVYRGHRVPRRRACSSLPFSHYCVCIWKVAIRP
jgi:hypothetical protein